MKKFLVKISLFLLGALLILTPFSIFLIAANNQPHVYSKTYYAALVDKVHNLEALKDEKKIVLIGGSNVAFGFNSELIEQEFPGYKVVNFGLYAMLGTKIMMDLALEYIGPDDMIFVIPEINTQSTSLYFDPESALKAVEDDMSILFKLPKDNRESTIGSYFSFAVKKSNYSKPIEPSGVYQRKNFNKYGDIKYDELDSYNIPYRSSNRMTLHYDPTMLIDYSYPIEQVFYEYVNMYNEKICEKNAKLFYGFSPVNEKAVSNIDSITDYYWSLRKHLACEVIGNPSDYVIDAHYFYDSNFHLNDAGAIYRTFHFVKDIYRDIYKISQSPKFSIPDKPDYIEINPEETDDDPNCVYFDFVEEEAGYVIKGINKDGLALSSIRLPSIYNHKYVIGIAKHVFANSNLEEVVVPNSFRFFENEAFDNCTSLKTVYLETLIPSELIVDYLGGFINNVREDFKIAVPNTSLNAYKVDYNWQFYDKYLVGYDYDSNK